MVPNPAGIYWASAASPRHDMCAFAIAASNGSVLLQENGGQWGLQRSQCAEGQKEAVAIDWLSPSVILKSCREGAVRLWDIRIRAESSEPRIQHPITIIHVRSINDTFVVVAGLQHQVSNESCMQRVAGLTLQLCTYDLRFANRANPDQVTQYYDWFPTYRNNVLSHHSIGLDVHNNVAAATDDRRVQIFDVKQGVELKSGIRTFAANAECVRFVDEQRSGDGLKLLVAAGPKIDEWAFEGSMEKSVFSMKTGPTDDGVEGQGCSLFNYIRLLANLNSRRQPCCQHPAMTCYVDSYIRAHSKNSIPKASLSGHVQTP